MASRRMFSKDVVENDLFLDMPSSAQALYFHLGLRADDDGFVGNPRSVLREVQATIDDLRLLLDKGFVIAFENGVIVITHWRVNNYIQRDRYKTTVYQDELKRLKHDEIGVYTILYTECIQNVYEMDTQVRLGKDRLELGENIYSGGESKKSNPQKPTKHKYGFYKNVLLSNDDVAKLKNEFPDDYQDRIERLSDYIASKGKRYKNHLATIRSWARRETEQNKLKNNALNKKWCTSNEDVLLDDIFGKEGQK